MGLPRLARSFTGDIEMTTKYEFSDSIAIALACVYAIIHRDSLWGGWGFHFNRKFRDLMKHDDTPRIRKGVRRLFKKMDVFLQSASEKHLAQEEVTYYGDKWLSIAKIEASALNTGVIEDLHSRLVEISLRHQANCGNSISSKGLPIKRDLLTVRIKVRERDPGDWFISALYILEGEKKLASLCFEEKDSREYANYELAQ
jgi:hypothetical protein